MVDALMGCMDISQEEEIISIRHLDALDAVWKVPQPLSRALRVDVGNYLGQCSLVQTHT